VPSDNTVPTSHHIAAPHTKFDFSVFHNPNSFANSQTQCFLTYLAKDTEIMSHLLENTADTD